MSIRSIAFAVILCGLYSSIVSVLASDGVPFAPFDARGITDPDDRALYAATLYDTPENQGRIALVNANTDSFSIDKALEAKWRAADILEIYPPLLDARPAINPWRFSEDKTKQPYRLPLSMLDEFQQKNALRYSIFGAVPTHYVRTEMTVENTAQFANFIGLTETGRTIPRYEPKQVIVGVRTFSRIAFNEDHTLAIVAWVDLRSSGISGGSGETWLFEKKDGIWQRAKELADWVN